MHRLVLSVAGAIGLAVASGAAPHAQTATRANWLTDGGDAQRTSWQRHETLISPASVKNMTLLWKLKLDNQPREMHNLFAPLILGDLQVASGAREIAVVAGISDNIYGIDVEKGTQIWKRHFDSTFDDTGRSGGPLCPGGQTATPIAVPTETPGKYVVYAISWDGRLRTVDPSTGQEIARAEPFLPANGKPYSLNIFNNVLYTTTAQGCGGTPNQFYGYDLKTKKVGSFNPGSGGMWPRLGPSIGKDGSVYAGSGDGDYFPERQIFGQAIVAVKQNPETKALEMTDWYAPSNAYWLRKRDLDMNATGPVFEYKGKEYTVHTSKECRLWLLDTSAMGGEDHRTPVAQTPLICNEEVQYQAAGPWGALATWEDADGSRWILFPFWGPKHSTFSVPREHGQVVRGAVAAFRLQEQGGGLALAPAWISRNIDQADPVVVANGVVFGFGSGEDPTQASVDIGLSYGKAANRVAHSGHATLHAFDARSGDELWSSGDQIKSFNHFSSLSVANGRVYIGTYDGMLYCFGVDTAASSTNAR